MHIELLCADFRAGIRGFDCLHKSWTAAAEREGLSTGGHAYLYQKADMYRRMRNKLAAAYKKALKPGIDPEALDHHLVHLPQPTYLPPLGLGLQSYFQPVRPDLEGLVRTIVPYKEVLELLKMD